MRGNVHVRFGGRRPGNQSWKHDHGARSPTQHIPFDPDAASLFYQLIASRYERASLIVSSNKNFSAWAEIFGDAVAVAAMVDRLVHHAHIIVLKGDSYRLQGKHKDIIDAQPTH